MYFSSSTKEFHRTVPTYVDSKVTVGMVLHSGLIKDDTSKYTKTILDFISFINTKTTVQVKEAAYFSPNMIFKY